MREFRKITNNAMIYPSSFLNHCHIIVVIIILSSTAYK